MRAIVLIIHIYEAILVFRDIYVLKYVKAGVVAKVVLVSYLDESWKMTFATPFYCQPLPTPLAKVGWLKPGLIILPLQF